MRARAATNKYQNTFIHIEKRLNRVNIFDPLELQHGRFLSAFNRWIFVQKMNLQSFEFCFTFSNSFNYERAKSRCKNILFKNRPLHHFQGFIISSFSKTVDKCFWTVRMMAINPRWVCLLPWVMNENIWWLFIRSLEIWQHNRIWSRKFNVLCRNENKTTSPPSICVRIAKQEIINNFICAEMWIFANIKCNSPVLFNEWNVQKMKESSFRTFICLYCN